MAESQVSIEGRTHAMDPLFFVSATQNPVEFRGTYPLPEAQMDRFAMNLNLGYVSPDQEVDILSAQEIIHPLELISPCLAMHDVLGLKRAAKQIRISPELKR